MRRGEPRGQDADAYFPTYEEVASELLDCLERTGLTVQDVAHELEPGTGERTFQCTVRAPGGEPPYRYSCSVHFHWDALLTFLGAYGPGSDCELYHEDDEPCPHQERRPRPTVEVVTEYDLGDGGYQLSELEEMRGWIATVESLLQRAVPDQEELTVRLGLAVREGAIWVDRFFAEQPWFVDLALPPDLSRISEAIAATLKVTPSLADRLPL